MTACRFTSEPLAGTAPQAATWWLVEDPGPWGDRAPATSRLPGIRDLVSNAQRRVLLVRPTTRRASTDAGIVVWIASGDGGQPVRYVADDPRDLPHWPVTGDPGVLRTSDETDAPRLLVCTNSARDACCGVVGRELLRTIGPRPGLWESSHLGGHRFAPTALAVQQGMTYGRLDHLAATRILASSSLDPELAPYMRGCPGLTAVEQVAQIAVLEAFGQAGTVTNVEGSTARVATTDGTVRTVVLAEVAVAARPASCGADPTTATAWVAAGVS